MKTIYLENENYNWIMFSYNDIDEIAKELNKRSIVISNDSYVNNAYIGNKSRVDGGSVVTGKSRVDGGSVVGGGSVVDGGSRVTGLTAMFATNLYKYSSWSGFNKNGEQIVRMGCYQRTRKE